jgi:GMP reductase
MRIETDIKLDFSDVLFKPKRSTLRSRKEVDLSRTFTFKHSGNTWTGTPIIASNMTTIGTFEMYSELSKSKMLTFAHKFYTPLDWSQRRIDFDYIAPSIGANSKDLSNFEVLYNQYSDRLKFVVLDVANGYGEYLSEFVKDLRKKYPQLIIVAGNVVTAEMTEQLILSGADVAKVGLGSGSCCTTRIQTGVGAPQLSAVIECADAAHGLGGHIISDGGCTCPGDVAKAFGAGADFVMLGGMLAGHDESGGELVTEFHRTNQLLKDLDGSKMGFLDIEKKYKIFYGMSSETAMEKHNGGMAEYRSSEGRTVKVEYKGPVEKTIQNILGGLRSAGTYIGAQKLKDFSKCCTFVRVNHQHNSFFENR